MINFSALNEKYKSYSYKERMEEVFRGFDEDKIMVTSSFGSTSVVLLHLLSEVKPGYPVHFINTSYLFKETLEYKDLLIKRLNLKIIELKADKIKNKFTRENETWHQNHDLCCFINKVDPVDRVKDKYSIWISGLLGYQNANRRNLKIFEWRDDIIKFHPIIDMTAQDVALYMKIYDLPAHNLVYQGYSSIGCTHCTKKGNGRNGRWADKEKTECGLHV